MNKHVLKYAVMILTFFIGIALLISCKDTETESADPETGGIVARLVWEDESSISKSLSVESQNNAALPAEVKTIRALVSASDITTIQKDFTASTGSGSISSIPVGSNRTLTLKGLDSGGTMLYEGVKPGIIVTGGETTDAGTITMAVVP